MKRNVLKISRGRGRRRKRKREEEEEGEGEGENIPLCTSLRFTVCLIYLLGGYLTCSHYCSVV